jgi:hypothetical protein
MGYRKQLPIRTEQLKVMGVYSIKKRKPNKIDYEFKQSVQHRITQATTTAEKRAVVAEANPLFYVFGETRKVFKPYLTYEENYGIE